MSAPVIVRPDVEPVVLDEALLDDEPRCESTHRECSNAARWLLHHSCCHVSYLTCDSCHDEAVRFLLWLDRRLYDVSCGICGARNPSVSWRRL